MSQRSNNGYTNNSHNQQSMSQSRNQQYNNYQNQYYHNNQSDGQKEYREQFLLHMMVKENLYQLENDFRGIIMEARKLPGQVQYLSPNQKAKILKVCQFDLRILLFCRYHKYKVDVNLLYDHQDVIVTVENQHKYTSIQVGKYVETLFRKMHQKIHNYILMIQSQSSNQQTQNRIDEISHQDQVQSDIFDTRHYQELDDISDDEQLKQDESNLNEFTSEDEIKVLEIINKYIKVHKKKTNCIQDLRYYLNRDQELILQYIQQDNKKDILQQTRRIRFSKLLQDTMQHFPPHQIEELIESMLNGKEMFIMIEITQYQQRDVLSRIIVKLHATQTYIKVVKGHSGTQLKAQKFSQSKVYIIKPLSLETDELYADYPILIVQDSHKLFFLNYKALISVIQKQNDHQLLNNLEKIHDTYQQNLELQFNAMCDNEGQDDTQASQYLTIIKESMQEYYDKQFYSSELQEFYQELQKLTQDIEHLNELQGIQMEENKLFAIEHKISDLIPKIDDLKVKIHQINTINEEYQKVIRPIKYQLGQYVMGAKLQRDKEILKRLKIQAMIEFQRCQQRLPIYLRKSELVKLIQHNQVTLLIGETGSGKSTQLVQYLAENICLDGKQIICTQPRVLAAKSLAKRVAEELKTELGAIVGINLDTESKISDQTKICFSQDRVLLNELAIDPMLSRYKVIVVDEAHERTTNTDILLGLLKELCVKRPDLRLVITSATMDEELFAKYFNVNVFKVEGRIHQVKVKYEPFSYLESQVDKASEFLQQKIIKKIKNNTYRHKHVLIFMTGVDEVNTMMDRFESSSKIKFLPLHGMLTHEEQFEVFQESEDAIKIIFSTRISETALTINDVSIVVDLGYDRFQQFDQVRGMSLTTIGMISQSQANQRKGRAGRTGPGICYRLYSLDQWSNMHPHKQSEIQRMSLDIVVLRLKQFNIPDVTAFNFIEKPNLLALKISEEYLFNIKALKGSENHREITELGRFMAQLSTEPRISRILIESYYLNCLSEVLSIVSVLQNNQFLFVRGKDDQQTQNIMNKLTFFDDQGDLMTFLNVYNDWERESYNSRRNGYQLKNWCRKNSLNYKALKQSEQTRKELQNAFRNLDEKMSRDFLIERELRSYMITDDCEEDYAQKKIKIIRCFLTAYFPDLCVFNEINDREDLWSLLSCYHKYLPKMDTLF